MMVRFGRLDAILRPPAPDASRAARYRFVRRCGLFVLPFMVPVWVVLLAFGSPTYVLVLVGVGTLGSLANIASLTWKTRRQDQPSRG